MSSQLVLPSTLMLTLLLMVGLFFFIRASTKDRTEVRIWSTTEPGESVLTKVEKMLKDRSYRITEVNPNESKAVFEGLVRPSLALAILLVSLAATAIIAFSIVVSMSLPLVGLKSLGLVLVSPLAGFFYWRGAERVEKVVVQVGAATVDAPVTTLRITAHRDELLVLEDVLPYQVI
jgi:hypothetical protein